MCSPPRGNRATTIGLIAVLCGMPALNSVGSNDPVAKPAVAVLERAYAQVRRAQSSDDFAVKMEALDRAAGILATFIEANPDHPQLGRIHSERGRIQLQRAQAMRSHAESAADESRREQDRLQIRGVLGEAEAALKAALRIHERERGRFPVYIDAADREQRQAQEKALAAVMQDELQLAVCLYERSLTSDADSVERRDLLGEAARQFEALHRNYRTLVAGVYARLWQARCLELLGERASALEIYAELATLPAQSKSLQEIASRAQHFRLLCLNGDEIRQHQLAIDEATRWLEEHEADAVTQTGLAIRYERLRALLAAAREGDAVAGRDLLTRALADAEFIARHPGPVQRAAEGLVESLETRVRK